MLAPIQAVMSVPYVPSISTSSSIASNNSAIDKSNYGTIGVCFAVPTLDSFQREDLNSFVLDLMPRSYAWQIFHVKPSPDDPVDYERAKIDVVKGPVHGKVVGDYSPGGHLHYIPDDGFSGKDQLTFKVYLHGGYVVNVIYFIDVIPAEGSFNNYFDDYSTKHCPPPVWYSLPGHYTSSMQLNEFKLGDFSLLQNGKGSSLAQTVVSGVSVSYADLPGASIGQQQSGPQGTTITLDTDAAGYGWFMDVTPSDNIEFLPTSNPNEWIAKADSDAYGKMDMYTVLLHEMGHALGLDHSANAHHVMAPTLEPGVRHLLSDAERQVVANLAGIVLPEREPGQPLPSLPFDLSLMALALRRREAGSNLAGQDNNQGQGNATALANALHYDVVVHPALTNSDFNDADGWTTQGNVAISAGEAVLSEAANSQTRMNQLFTVGANDKFLRFTVSGVNLDNPGNLPEDAFEVALLDANTGESLLDTIDLSRADAIVNLQGDGTVHLSEAVSVSANADGSRTYVVDLSTIATGTAVNLSFGLLGFGQVQSQVTVRDLNLGLPQTLPQLHDDSVQTEEDTPLTVDALANDEQVSQAGFVPVIVDGPAHGQVVVNTDGTFAYTPDANYNGQDTFTYWMSNGELTSNTATVQINITPVNDAPVAGDITLTTDEDIPLTLDLLSQASDVDSPVLMPVIVTGPTHGQLTLNADGTYTYTPEANYSGSDSITYLVSDGELDSNPATVQINVTPVNDAPVAGDITLTTDEDTPLTLNLLDNASDVDSPVLTPVIVTGPTHGQLTLTDGTYTYTPEVNYSGSDSITYLVNDGELDSNPATVHINVTPVADAPSLVLVPQPNGGGTSELFRTDWESVYDWDSTSTLVMCDQLDGWNLITQRGFLLNGWDGFEVWSDNDWMTAPPAGLFGLFTPTHRVQSAPEGGRNWLELNDALGLNPQTLGIERTVNTVAGASYTLNLDYAGRIGYSSDYTAISVYVDGQKIGTYANTSPEDALAWHNIHFSFTGNGGPQTLRIVTDASRRASGGRGAMIDNLVLTQSLPANTAIEGGAIALPIIQAALTDIDGSETLSLIISGLPVGTQVTDGTHSFTATNGHTAADITGWALDSLTLTPPVNLSGNLTVSIHAIATEQANGHSATTSLPLTLTVLSTSSANTQTQSTQTTQATGQAPLLARTMQTNQARLSGLVMDATGHTEATHHNTPVANTINSSPIGRLIQQPTGAISYLSNSGATGSDRVTYRANNGCLTAMSITIGQAPTPPSTPASAQVLPFSLAHHPVMPENRDHRDGKSASARFTSTWAPPREPHQMHYLVINQNGQTRQTPPRLDRIDWQGRAESQPYTASQAGQLHLNGNEHDPDALGKLCGLIIKKRG